MPASATPDQAQSALRSFLIAFGAYGAGKGWFDANLFAAALPVIMIAFPMVWGVLKAGSQHGKLAAVAQAAQSAPVEVAKVGK